MFLNLRPKYSDSTHAPRTIIGKDYPTSIQGSVGQHQFFTAIQRSDKDYEVTEAAVPYGPFYRAWDEEMWKILKEKSWAHILATSGTSEQETVRLYLEAVQEVEIESRQLYGGDDSMDFCGDNYKWMMIIDGCFLLQVALAVLNGGGPEQVGHLRDFRMVIPPGERWQKKHPENQERGQNSTPSTMLKLAVSSMFIVGNQIPLVVLKALMRQTFFRNFINRGIWEEPSDLHRLVLFESLLVPMFQLSGEHAVVIPSDSLPEYSLNWHSCWLNIKSFKPFCTWHGKKKDLCENGATDLLHGLWLLVTGLTGSKEENADRDGSGVKHVHEEDIRRAYDHLVMRCPAVRSAKELKDIGITFQYTEGEGIHGIRFQKNRLSATLVLPRIVVVSEDDTYAFFSGLIRYEVKHFRESKRIVCQYLELMRGLDHQMMPKFLLLMVSLSQILL